MTSFRFPRRRRAGDPDLAPDRGGRRRDGATGPVGADRAARATDPDVDDTAAGGSEPAADGSARRGRFGRRRGKPRKKAPWWELPALIVVAILVAIVVKTFLVQPFFIPSSSMEKTLHGCEGCSGDRIVVNKPIYTVFRDPHPGDIVVFKAPSSWPREGPEPVAPANPVLRGLRSFGQLVGVVPPDEYDLIKRVIAVGGQTVKCCDAQGNVEVSDTGPNGKFYSLDDASFVYEDPGEESVGQAPFGPVTVPKGRLWVMGDHRDDSLDSRYHCGDGGPVGDGTAVCTAGTEDQAVAATVPLDNVRGKAVIIAWPPSRWTTLGTPTTFESVPLPGSSSALGAAGASVGHGGSGGSGPAPVSGFALLAPLGVGLVSAGGLRRGLRRRRRRRRA